MDDAITDIFLEGSSIGIVEVLKGGTRYQNPTAVFYDLTYPAGGKGATANVSVVDLTVELEKSTDYEGIKNVMKNASETSMKDVLGYEDEPVVSQDFIGDERTSIFDANAGIRLNDKFFKIISWYDNECGYSSKLISLAQLINNT